MKIFYVIFLNDYISDFLEFDEIKRISTSKFAKFDLFEFYSLRSILKFFDFVDEIFRRLFSSSINFSNRTRFLKLFAKIGMKDDKTIEVNFC